jgi:hypothetical protein
MLERQREFRELRAMRREEAVSTKWYNDFRAEEGRERRGRWGMAEAEGEMRSFLWDEAEKLRLQVRKKEGRGRSMKERGGMRTKKKEGAAALCS